MKRVSIAGLGALAFAILVFVASVIDSSPGGTYSASDVTDYLKSGHRPIVFVALYMTLLGIVGLLFLLSRLRDAIGDARRARVFWALSVGGASAFVVGWALHAAAPLAIGYGGNVSFAPQVTYSIAVCGYIVLSAGAIMLGLALLTLVLGPVELPAWVRWFTLVGVIGGVTPAFFPFGLFFIWALVLGIWLLATDRETVPSEQAVSA
jgi:uncharacterized membrane protein